MKKSEKKYKKVFSTFPDIAHKALHIASNIEKKKKKMSSNAMITIRWTAGHEGLEGNELADREAKEAAKGCTLDTKLLPPYLRKPLLTNLTAVKATHNESLKSEWRNEWRSAKREKAVAKIDDTTPSNKFLKALSNPKLLRSIASTIAQLRMTDIPLDGYLKRIQRVDNARCPACREDKESIEHFLLRCPSYAHERWTLTQHASNKCKALTLQILFGDPQFILPLAAYIQVIGRFMRPGEHSTTQTCDTA